MADYEAKTRMLTALFTIFFMLPLLAVVLRVTARRMKHMKLELDDYLAMAAMVSICNLQCPNSCLLFRPSSSGTTSARCSVWSSAKVGMPMLTDLALQEGLGKHVDLDLAADQLGVFMRLTYATEILYAWILVLSKWSILRLYIRIFGNPGFNQEFVHAVYLVSGLVGFWGLSMILPLGLQCKPLGAAWDPTKSRKKCLDLRPFLVGTNISNIVLDVAIIALPMFPVWRIKVTNAKKFGLTFVFLLSVMYVIPLSYSIHKLTGC